VLRAIETHALTKRFGATRALAGVDLKIAEGTVYGLLGPNGAGKTTMIRVPSTMATSFVFLFPLTFASDIFVKLGTMPAWLQAAVGRNPVTYLASASRKLRHGDDAATPPPCSQWRP
jgi:ABC-type protease/lipase transport system fused ATPase/permease subunit